MQYTALRVTPAGMKGGAVGYLASALRRCSVQDRLEVESSLSLPAVAVRRLELVVTEGVGLLCYRKAVLFCSAVQICEANLQGYGP